jgi:hypothetical protein
MKLTILTLALTASSLMIAQEKAPEPMPPNMVSAVIPVKTLSGDAFQRLVRLLKAFKVSFSADDRLRTILVYAPKDVVEQMKRVVQELDRPGSEAAVGRNIDLTLSFLRCSMKAPAEPSVPLPPELESVAKQLRAATPYKNVEVWDVLPMRIQEGKQTEQTARLPGKLLGANSPPPTAMIRLCPDAVSQKDTGRSVRFERFNINFHIPYVSGTFQPGQGSLVPTQYNFMDVGLNTSGDFKEGQKTVLGKVGLDDDSAVFVVVALKVLD